MNVLDSLNRLLILFIFVFFAISCRSQLAKEQNVDLQGSHAEKSALRVDSILQFSVMVTAIFEDSKGNFWFGSHGDGICRFDGQKYTYFTIDYGLPMGKWNEFAPGPDWSIVKKINSGNQIGFIQEDGEGNIWIMNGSNVVCMYDGHVFNKVNSVDMNKTLTSELIHPKEKRKNDLWFPSWRDRGVLLYDGNELMNINFPFPNEQVKSVSEIYKDQDGSLYFGTMDYGTYCYDGVNFKQIFEGGICRSVFQDDSGRTWIGNNRLAMFYIEGDSIVNFTEEYRRLHKNSMPENGEELDNAQSIEQDVNGDLWVGTFSGGLWRYDGKDLTHYTDVEGLPIITVKTIYKDRSGKLWYGIGEGSVYGYNGASFYRFDGLD